MPTVPPMGQSTLPGGNMNDRLIGSALLSNTTACEASRLLLPDEVTEHDPYQICDLMSLMDSAVLHEQIYYLPGSLPEDVPRLELRNRLIEIGALTSLPIGDDHNLIGEALMASLSTDREYCAITRGPGGSYHSFESHRPRLMEALGLVSVMDQTKDGEPAQEDYVWDNRADKSVEGRYTQGRMIRAESFDDAAGILIPWLGRGYTGRYEDSVKSLREMYYVFASEHYSLPYLASVYIQNAQRKFPNYFKPSVRVDLYQQLATALRTTVDTVAQEFDGPIFFIPPFSALVFDRAATPADIPTEMLALRAEYSGFRNKMTELEHDRLEARSLNDRMKALRRLEQLGKEVARPFDEPSRVKLEPALRYIPDAVDLAVNPTNPTGWAKVLLGLPTEALLSWYRRRPVAKLVRAGRTVGSLAEYGSLLRKHFGDYRAHRALQVQRALQEWNSYSLPFEEDIKSQLERAVMERAKRRSRWRRLDPRA
jgi:hypothetical protein